MNVVIMIMMDKVIAIHQASSSVAGYTAIKVTLLTRKRFTVNSLITQITLGKLWFMIKLHRVKMNRSHIHIIGVPDILQHRINGEEFHVNPQHRQGH